MTADKKAKDVLLTSDYELFLGERSGTVQNCLIIPTQRLLDVLSKHDAKSGFFIDTIYLYRLEQEATRHSAAKKDLEKIKEQLHKISSAGHYLFHHIHPHWMKAIYLPEMNQWENRDYSCFTISTLNKEDRALVFKISETILHEFTKDGSANGFRAGGLYIQPFNYFKEWFQQTGIRFEFSVLPRFKSEEEFYEFDFTLVDKIYPYRFLDDVTAPYAAGPFTEFPLSTIELKGLEKVIHSLWNRGSSKIFSRVKWGDGLGSGNKIFPVKQNSLMKSTETFSIELLHELKQLAWQRYLKKNDYLHIISHPKLFTSSHLNSLDLFLKKICRKYQVEFDFMKFTANRPN